MNSDNFSDFIEQPSHLYQIPYEELKSLVLQYPYCQNLRYLLLKKSKMENHRDFDKNLHMAATFSPDRAFLFQQIQKTAMSREAQEAYELAEDFLELKDLREVQKAMKEVKVEEVTEVDLQQDAIIIDSGPSIPDEDIPTPSFSLPEITPEEEEDLTIGHSQDVEEEIHQSQIPDLVNELVSDMGPAIDIVREMEFEIPVEEGETEEEQPLPKFELDELIIKDLSATSSLVDQLDFKSEKIESPEDIPVAEKEETPAEAVEPKAVKTPEPVKAPKEKRPDIPLEINTKSDPDIKPTPKTSFSSWLRQFQSPQVSVQLNQILEVDKPKKKKQKKKQTNKAKALAVQSVQEHGVASETLAGLLAKQGHYTKAYHMYMRLKSMIPERSDYFDEKLKELKPKLR